MKETAGEANMTVVTIILIGVIVAIATPIVTNMMNNTNDRAKCMNSGMCWTEGCSTGYDACCKSCGTTIK